MDSLPGVAAISIGGLVSIDRLQRSTQSGPHLVAAVRKDNWLLVEVSAGEVL